jgi:PAS domain S-box-containing protein
MDASLAHFAEEDVYRLVLESLEDGVYVVDTERRITYWNEGAERITGYLRQDVIGRQCDHDILAHCSIDGVTYCADGCPLFDTVRDGRPRRIDAFLRHQLGHRVPVAVRSAPIRDPAGRIVGAVEIFHVDSRHYGLLQKFSGLEAYNCLDQQTGIANHAMTLARLRHRLEDLRSFGIPLGVFLIQVQEHDQVQARGGGAAWVNLVAAVARTIAEIVPPNGFVGRWTDEGFLGLLGNTDPIALHEVTERVAILVRATRIAWWGETLRPAVSVRTSMAEPDDSPESAVARLTRLVQRD